MVAAARLLRGPARWAALPAAVAVLVMLGYCGWALAVPAVVAAAAFRGKAKERPLAEGRSRLADVTMGR
jgi:hypothetical protein